MAPKQKQNAPKGQGQLPQITELQAKNVEQQNRIATLETALATANQEKIMLLDAQVKSFAHLGQQTKSTIEAIDLKHAEELAIQTVTHSKEIANFVDRIKAMKVKLNKRTQSELELAKAKKELESMTDDKCHLMDSIEHEREESEGLRLQVKDLEAELEQRTSTEVEIKDAFAKRMTKLWRLKVAWYGMQREAALDVFVPDEVLAVYEENRRWQRYVNVERALRRAFRSFSAWVQDKLEFPRVSLASQQALDKSTKAMCFAFWFTEYSNAKMEKLVPNAS